MKEIEILQKMLKGLKAELLKVRKTFNLRGVLEIGF